MMEASDVPITIRDVEAIAEVHEVERLQLEVWGIPHLEVVPHTQLIAAKESGGVLIGAFDGVRMAGFVYGFVGLERGATVHHSHMLAVDQNYRGRDLGFRLKCEQRRRVLEQGIDVMTWTFDPLRSLNANLNLRRLGAIADRYYADFYGTEAGSFLHQNGTDRLWVSWHIASDRVERRLSGDAESAELSELPVLLAACDSGAPQPGNSNSAFAADRFAIEIPRDIGSLEIEDVKTRTGLANCHPGSIYERDRGGLCGRRLRSEKHRRVPNGLIHLSAEFCLGDKR